MNKLIRLSLWIILILLNLQTTQAQCDKAKMDSTFYPELKSISKISIAQEAEDVIFITSNKECGKISIDINGDSQELKFINGRAKSNIELDNKGTLYFLSYPSENKENALFHLSQKDKNPPRIKSIPLWYSLIPPLLAIILALVFKEVIVALFCGIWAGAFIAGGLRFESLYYFLVSFMESIEKYVIGALNDGGHLSVIVFSLLIGGMVAIISKNGGMAGVVLRLSKYAKSKRSSEFITWLLGIAIFFDDYANTLIVGNTMRSVTDKFKVSREKLAYIVDSTAAPVSAIAFITTWIGAELGYIDDGVSKIALGGDLTAYAIFISSLKYSFYPILTLAFILFIVLSKKDYGPMLKAEKRSILKGQVSPAKNLSEDELNMEDLSPVKDAPQRWYNAAIPVLTVILVTIFGLIDTGMTGVYNSLSGMEIDNLSYSWGSIWSNMNALGESGTGFFTKLGTLIGSSDSYVALLWASLSGVVIALILTVSQKIMTLFDSMHWMVNGFKTMMPALIILTLAWALAACTNELHTADFLSGALENSINPYLIPVIIFILAALIAFSTGSSWSTMAILYPIAIPTCFAICQANGISDEMTFELLLNVIATVLAASVLGDHCSPISDTTILSSLASDCNHIDHVRTQLPYALTVGLVSITCVGLSTLLGGGWLISIALLISGMVLLWFIVQQFGKRVEVSSH